METVGIIIVLASMAAALFGLVNLVKPLGFLGIRRRRWAAAVVGGSVVAFMVGSVIGAAGSPGGLEGAASAGRAEPAPAAPTKAPPRPAGVTREEFQMVWSQVKAQMEPCDAAVQRAGQAMQTGDAYAAYPLVTRAQSVCQDNWMAVGDIDIPRSAKGDVRKAIVEARDGCGTALFVKQDAMEQVAKVVDGEGRPSAVSAARQRMEEAGSMTMVCIVGFMRAGEATGHTLPEFEQATAAAKAG